MRGYGKRIAKLRESKNLTQEKLAKIINISRSTLSHYEQNRREPDYVTLSKIADYFNISIDALLGRPERPFHKIDLTRNSIEYVELTNPKQIDKVYLTIDGKPLTPEEIIRFVAFIQSERSIRHHLHTYKYAVSK